MTLEELEAYRAGKQEILDYTKARFNTLELQIKKLRTESDHYIMVAEMLMSTISATDKAIKAKEAEVAK